MLDDDGLFTGVLASEDNADLSGFHDLDHDEFLDRIPYLNRENNFRLVDQWPEFSVLSRQGIIGS